MDVFEIDCIDKVTNQSETISIFLDSLPRFKIKGQSGKSANFVNSTFSIAWSQ